MSYAGGEVDTGRWRGTRLVQLAPTGTHPLGALTLASLRLLAAARDGNVAEIHALLQEGAVHVDVADEVDGMPSGPMLILLVHASLVHVSLAPLSLVHASLVHASLVHVSLVHASLLYASLVSVALMHASLVPVALMHACLLPSCPVPVSCWTTLSQAPVADRGDTAEFFLRRWPAALRPSMLSLTMAQTSTSACVGPCPQT